MLCDASKFVTEGMKELNRKAGERKQKIVFKMMYDRGNLKQASIPTRSPTCRLIQTRLSKTISQCR